MPRGQLNKDHFKVLLLQQMNKVEHEKCSEENKDLVKRHLTEILDRLDEFRF